MNIIKKLSRLFNFSCDIGIDLGTANTLVFVGKKGILVNEPSVVAIKTGGGKKNEILAVGNEAKLMVGRTPANINAMHPMRDGVIADYEIAQEMIKTFIQKVNKNLFVSPRVIICVPYGATTVDRKAIHDSAVSAGARKVILIDEPLAAAIGAELPVELPKGSMIVDIGGGTTEIGIISLGNIAAAKSYTVGGYKMDEAIKEYINKHFCMKIGDSTAEEIKKEIGIAFLEKGQAVKEKVIRGFDAHKGVPKEIVLKSTDIMESLLPILRGIGDAISNMFELKEVTYDLCADIARDGVVLSGGGALLPGIDKFLSDYTKLEIKIAPNPLLCVINGLGKIIENEESFSAIIDAI